MIVVSSCLMGESCKYNGGNNDNAEIKKFLAGKKYLCLCPEVLGGLPIPRAPVELKEGRAVNNIGEDKTANFIKGAETVLDICKRIRPELIILKESSPSCGINSIYDGSFSHTLIPGMGITAALLKENGFRVISEKDIHLIIKEK